MAVKPSQLPTWATSGTNIAEPASGRKIAGWLAGMAAAHTFFNWWQNLVYQWVAWFKQSTDAVMRERIANAIAKGFVTGNIVGSGYQWKCGAISDIGSNGLVSPRYWVVGDNGSGNTAIAYSGSAGSAWANVSGSAQAGSLGICAANDTLCMGLETGVTAGAWKLGGSTSANGSLPVGEQAIAIICDTTHNLWVAVMTSGIYTSPLTAIAWTRRHQNTAWNVTDVAILNGRLVACGSGGLLYSTDALTWTAGYVDASSAWVSPTRIVANSLGFWIFDANACFYSADGTAITDISGEPAILSSEKAFVWQDMVCVPGIYMSPDPRLNEWNGVTFTLGVGEVLRGGKHGAIACGGTATATVFGPTIDMTQVPFAA